MEAPNFKYCYIFLIIVLISQYHIEAVEFIVGGKDDQWTTSVNYQRWSENYTFFVGDVLVFNYVQGLHNTYEVTQETYRTCNTSQGVIESYYSGHDRVTLNEARDYWFLCNIPGHCLGGMKFGVKVESSNGTSETSGCTMRSTPSTSIGQYWGWVWAFHLVAIVALLIHNLNLK